MSSYVVRLNRRTNGFTLIEALITIFIIGIAFLLYYSAMRNTYLSRDARDEEIALHIAAGKMEDLRAGGYAALPSSGSFSDSQLSSLPSSAASMTIADYNAQTKEVTVTVSWTEPAVGTSRNVTLSTLITNTGGL